MLKSQSEVVRAEFSALVLQRFACLQKTFLQSLSFKEDERFTCGFLPRTGLYLMFFPRDLLQNEQFASSGFSFFVFFTVQCRPIHRININCCQQYVIVKKNFFTAFRRCSRGISQNATNLRKFENSYFPIIEKWLRGQRDNVVYWLQGRIAKQTFKFFDSVLSVYNILHLIFTSLELLSSTLSFHYSFFHKSFYSGKCYLSPSYWGTRGTEDASEIDWFVHS